MKYFQAKRLLKLAEFMKTVPTKLFDINDWYVKTECGTVCCLGGWACKIPSFKKAGLNMNYNTKEIMYKKSIYQGNFFSLESFFGLNARESDIFCSYGYDKFPVKPKDTIKAIHEIVGEYYPHLVNKSKQGKKRD